MLYSAEHVDKPEWGVKGNRADMTGDVYCCLGDEDLIVTVENKDDYVEATATYRPVQYDRSKGYKGQTYVDAFAWCGEHGQYSLCPFEAVCPDGFDSEPLGGYKEGGQVFDLDEDVEESWIPILTDAGNEWVNVAPMNACAIYSHEHPGPPEWGVTGKDNEAITRNLLW